MRLSILPILLAGVSIATLVAAEPIRVVVESPSNANANIRFGHALANANVNGNDDNVRVGLVRPQILAPLPPEFKNKGTGISRHFCGASLREKALRLSNALRHALGLPLIEEQPHTAGVMARPGEMNILPVGPLPPPHPVEGGKVIFFDHSDNEQGKHGKHAHQHGLHKTHKSFLRRIHRAIKALGPWEGRAVAFVLGCGIGVLLRMFWVLSVLTYRTVRGEREEDVVDDREYIVYEQVPETLFVAPPEYTDEKAKMPTNEETERK